jgi:hypothetical protein
MISRPLFEPAGRSFVFLYFLILHFDKAPERFGVIDGYGEYDGQQGQRKYPRRQDVDMIF